MRLGVGIGRRGKTPKKGDDRPDHSGGKEGGLPAARSPRSGRPRQGPFARAPSLSQPPPRPSGDGLGGACREAAKVVAFAAALVVAAAGALLAWHSLSGSESALYSPADVEYSFVYKSYVPNADGARDLDKARQEEEAAAEGYPFYKRSTAEVRDVSRLRYMHMGMLETLPNGSLAAFFQSGESVFEGVEDQSIFWATSEDLGRTWATPRVLVSSNRKLPIWSPVAHRHGDRTFLFFARSSKYCAYFDKSKGVLRHSPGTYHTH